MNKENEPFRYTYSAPSERERREIEEIRRAYRPQADEDKLKRLRRLNARVKNVAMCVSLSLGAGGLLLFGLGLTLTLAWGNYAAGIFVALLGVFPMAAANPVHRLLLKRGKAKYGEEILRLSEELLGGEK